MKAVQLLMLAHFTLATLDCKPEGPVVPRPSDLANSDAFKKGVSSIEKVLQKALAGEITAGWATDNTSFSLAVVSVDQSSPETPLWEYHHLAKKNVNGTKELTRDSQYLIGSVSKVFSDLILLKSGLNLDDPVTKYISQLNDPSSLISWGNVSLRALGSQLSGTPANFGFSEYHFLKHYLETFGLPSLDDDAFASCGVTGLNKACTRDELLKGMLKTQPITAPMERPAYSNLAFTLLIFAVEQVTGKDYTKLVLELITEPLGLRNTSPSPGDTQKAVIPPVDNSWGSDYGLNAPGGGLVSSLSDLSALAHGILSRTILSPTETREWLKPHSFVGSPYSFAGFPWEIYRPPALVPEHPHQVTIYAKSGGAYGYRSQFAILDEYGIAVILLSAGDMAAVPYIYDALLSTFVPAVDAIAREQADSLTGTFTSGTKTDGKGACVDATIVQDADSLLLSGLSRNGSDILSAITKIWTLTVGKHLTPINSTFRLFPTEDARKDTLDGKTILRESWRLWFSPVYGDASDLPGKGLGSHDCTSWTLNDWIYYGSEPIDRFVFVRDAENGEVLGLEVPFLRSGLLGRVGPRRSDESVGC
ncbi:beta-lactamase family protein [Colletotrichum truncatum]|uniref:Beta-lactamase family protein n=1 Tax=Colletotrichum truncatum TaxID=5467 RepID=A0ACC3YNW2_COLTU|nr:beta-lactamase family protein [Colletotrichum truncatum]KAF6781135.1 beta-lactamase family protein [Colletotrichum truncatum]